MRPAARVRRVDCRRPRTRLLADVVTGKLDVRGFVPPEEIGPVELGDADLDEDADEGLGGDDEAGVAEPVEEGEH